MNLTDLSEVLRERADVPDPVQQARLAGVRAKVRASRRRRAVAGAACVVLALVGVVFAVVPRSGPSSEPAVPVRSFPEYHDGTRLAGQTWVELPSTSATVRFVPEALDFKLFWKCDIGKERALSVTVTVNGKPYAGGTCDMSTGGSYVDWADLGVVVGLPFEATLTVDGEQGGFAEGGVSEVAPPPHGSFGIGIGAGVPPSDYPFPPRPEELKPLGEEFGKPALKLSGDPADPDGKLETTVEWPGRSSVVARSNTPGRLRVLVNDVQVVDYSNWTYEPGSSTSLPPDHWEGEYGLVLSKGDLVRITVIPERMSGDWRVDFHRQ